MGVVRRIRLPLFLAICQVVFIIVFGIWGKYGETADAKYSKDNRDPTDTPIRNVYALFQDVHVMIFVGIGFLYAYLKRHGFTSIGMNMLIGALIIQWSALVRGIVGMVLHGKQAFVINVDDMLLSEFCAAVVLISWGGILGKSSPMQVMVMGLIEVIIYQINEWIAFELLQIVDLGESVLLHAFAAYFGMAVARVLSRSDVEQSKKEGTVYHSDIFALLGTVFLWVFWPSFNGASVVGDSRHRAVINTYYSLSACCIATFAISGILDKKGKLETSHVQNATLAGGVSIGAAAALMVQPWGALLIGALGGVVSVLGYKYLSPFLLRKIKLHDTGGIHNLHGMPGILGGLAAAVFAALANEDVYGPSLYLHFPARAPENGTDLLALQARHSSIEAGSGRSAVLQAGYQIMAIVITLAVATVGGILTGDDAFGLKTYMQKPYSQRGMTHDERIFNYRLSRARRVVENAFGILANRFQVLMSTMQHHPCTIRLIVTTCLVLHNLMRTRYPLMQNRLMDREDRNQTLIPGEWRSCRHMHDCQAVQGPNRDNREGKKLRNLLKHWVNSPAGSVPWQNNMI